MTILLQMLACMKVRPDGLVEVDIQQVSAHGYPKHSQSNKKFCLEDGMVVLTGIGMSRPSAVQASRIDFTTSAIQQYVETH